MSFKKDTSINKLTESIRLVSVENVKLENNKITVLFTESCHRAMK